jgi:D-glycero-D-manno-heptose 1,7-bisphosphate phosphatase
MKEGVPALFLDRDGVVNRNHGYVFEISNFEFHPEIFEICLVAKSAGMPIVIVTNQSGIGRGFFSESEYQNLTQWMISEFRSQGIAINAVFHAPENPESKHVSIPERRKPSPEMFFEAAKKFDLNLHNSVMIGDNESDMAAAQRAGVEHRILIGELEGSTVASDSAVNHQQCIEIFRKIVSGIQE